MSASTADGADTPRLRVRAAVSGRPRSSVSTGLPVLDHLISLLAEYAALDLSLEVQPGAAADEVAAAGRALGEALAAELRSPACAATARRRCRPTRRWHTSRWRRPGRPLVVSNVDLTAPASAGWRRTSSREFLRQLAEGAGLTLHVRLIEGRDTEHVLEAIFKALGVALAQAGRPRGTPPPREE